jgi:hypothetical protein
MPLYENYILKTVRYKILLTNAHKRHLLPA